MKAKKILIITGAVAVALFAVAFIACRMFLWDGYMGKTPTWVYIHAGSYK